MSEELTLLQKLMTSKPPTRRITVTWLYPKTTMSSKPPTRRITDGRQGAAVWELLSRLHGG